MRWHRNASVSFGPYNQDETFMFSINWRGVLPVFYIQERSTFRYDTVVFLIPNSHDGHGLPVSVRCGIYVVHDDANKWIDFPSYWPFFLS